MNMCIKDCGTSSLYIKILNMSSLIKEPFYLFPGSFLWDRWEIPARTENKYPRSFNSLRPGVISERENASKIHTKLLTLGKERGNIYL